MALEAGLFGLLKDQIHTEKYVATFNICLHTFFCKNLRNLTSTLFIHLHLPLLEYIFLPKNTHLLKSKKTRNDLDSQPSDFFQEKIQPNSSNDEATIHPISSPTKDRSNPSAKPP